MDFCIFWTGSIQLTWPTRPWRILLHRDLSPASLWALLLPPSFSLFILPHSQPFLGAKQKSISYHLKTSGILFFSPEIVLAPPGLSLITSYPTFRHFEIINWYLLLPGSKFLHSGFQSVVPGPAMSESSGNLLEMQHPRRNKSKALGPVKLSPYVRFENHHSEPSSLSARWANTFL